MWNLVGKFVLSSWIREIWKLMIIHSPSMRVLKSTHFVELKTTCFKWKPCIKCIVVSHLQVSAWQKGFNNRQIFPFFLSFWHNYGTSSTLDTKGRERSGTNHKDLEQLEYEINMNYIIIMQNSNLTEVWVEI